jgi:predicted Zn-dependent protease
MRLHSAAALAAMAATALLQAQEHKRQPFTFTNVDLKLLDQCAALEQQFENRALVYHSVDIENRLREIAGPMLPIGRMERVEWKFHVLRDPMINAFALPNGSIYINTGLLARAENDDELAGVLAHEVTHVVNRHGFIFNRSLRKKIVAMDIIGIAASWIPAGSWGAAVAIAANMGQFAIVSEVYGYSRELEEEADQIGLERLQGTGRDPAQLIRMFELFDERLEPEPVPRFLWDHPPLRERITQLRKMAHVEGPVTVRRDSEYLDWVRPAILQNIQMDIDNRRFRSALAAALRLAEAHRADAIALYWVGNCYRSLGPRQEHLTQEESTDGGLRQGYKRVQKRTEEEDLQALAATAEGRERLAANQRKSEEYLLKAAAADPSMPDAQFSLGALYEQEGKAPEAIDAYRKSIELTKSVSAREKAERRVRALVNGQQGAGK